MRDAATIRDTVNRAVDDRLPQEDASNGTSATVGDIVPDLTRRVTIPKLPLITSQGSANDCGPHALAMAASTLLDSPVSPAECAERLRLYRLPGVGATMPWGIPLAAAQLGLRSHAGVLGTTDDLTAAIDAGRPVVVLVHPSDFAVRWFDLHYRVVVGYERAESGAVARLLLACSATPAPVDSERGWNLIMSIQTFAAQWHTYLVPRWYAELWMG
jgi:hypothetical protein